MKKRTPRITLLGNNSGRNLGDAAIMSSILESLAQEIPEAEVLVPSLNPDFIDEHYGEKYNVKGIDVRPKTISMRLLGIPTLRCLATSDVALICDGIIFGRHLFSPHNFLITLIFLVPWAKLCGCKVVCFSCGIGPFPSKLSRVFARWVIQLSDLVIMREHDSATLTKELGVTKPVQVTGDAAFVNPISGIEGAQRIAQENNIDLNKPMLGLNITPYIDSWLEKDERILEKDRFVETYASGVRQALDRIEDESGQRPQCVVFSCSPMDEEFSQRFAELINGVVVDNSRYLSHDIQAMMRCCGLLVGMRFHSCVLASAAGTPIVGLVYAPKVRGYMRLLECEEYSVELKDIESAAFPDVLTKGWQNRKEIQQQQQKIVDELRVGALDATTQLRKLYFPEAKIEATASKVANT